VKGGGHGAPPVVGADGVVYVPLDEGLYAYQADGTELWALNGGRCGPVAIGADGTTYVVCDSTLYALGP
jgi:outer membrane protein assembly factor BamB